MSHKVEARHKELGAGIFECSKPTLKDAIEAALGLRDQGLEVKVTGPDGKPIDIDDAERP